MHTVESATSHNLCVSRIAPPNAAFPGLCALLLIVVSPCSLTAGVEPTSCTPPLPLFVLLPSRPRVMASCTSRVRHMLVRVQLRRKGCGIELGLSVYIWAEAGTLECLQ